MTGLDLAATPVLLVMLAALTVTDLRYRRLPDRLTLPLVIAGLLLAVPHGLPQVQSRLIGAALGFGIFWAIGAAFFRLRGVEGLGLGDAKLFAAAGAWLGWTPLPVVLLVASFGGLGQSLIGRSRADREIPFGPWLCLGFAACWTARLIWPGSI